MKKNNWFCLLLAAVSSTYANVSDELSLENVLQNAVVNSPRVTVSQFNEMAAKKGIDVARAGYFPTIQFESIYTKGFPGASGALEIGGVMGSSYRKGMAAGVVAEQTILDFGRTSHAVTAAEYQTAVTQQESSVTSYEIKRLALQKFYHCVRFKTQSELWASLETESAAITKEVEHFVHTGQRSVVDKYLSEVQKESASSTKQYYQESLKQSMRELAVVMGTQDHTFVFASLDAEIHAAEKRKLESLSNPFVERAKVYAQLAHEKLQQEKAERYPTIKAIATYGKMEQARLVPKEDYALGVGFSVPVLDLATRSKINQAEMQAYASEKEVDAQKQWLDEMNASYDETIQGSEVLLKRMMVELDLAEKAFQTAKRRYSLVQGDLIDLREAFRNLSIKRTTYEDTRIQFLIALGEKALLNGNFQ